MKASFAEGWTRFFDDMPLDAGCVRFFRVTFFTLVAIDVWRRLASSAIYGADGFNVTHLTPIEAWMPTPNVAVVVALRFLQLGLAVRMAWGPAPRWVVPLLATSYGATYFISRLDGYQHHYLIFLLLVILSFVDWSRPTAKSWPFRLLLVQLSITYLCTAVTKMDPLWVDGTLLSQQVSGETLQWLTAFTAAKAGRALQHGWALSAVTVLVAELFLVLALQVRRLQPLAWMLGMVLHAGVEMAGLRIGLFSWYLFGLYVLILPAPIASAVRITAAAVTRRWTAWTAHRWMSPARVLGQGGRRSIGWLTATSTRSWALLAMGTLFAAWTVGRLPIAGALVGAVALALVVLAVEWSAGRRETTSRASRSVQQLALGVGVLLATTLTDSVSGFALVTAQEWMRQGREQEAAVQLDLALGASQTPELLLHSVAVAMREGESPDLAKLSYQRLVDIAPEHFHGTVDLAHLYRHEGDWRRASELYRRATTLAPDDPRPKVLLGVSLIAGRRSVELTPTERDESRELFLQAGRVHAQEGERRRAVDAFTRALIVDETCVEARRALERLDAPVIVARRTS
ncbi:MAG: HTTM domain-containing protein [Acidobacteriota bacterium]